MRYCGYAALALFLVVADYAVAKPLPPFMIKLQQLGDGRCLLSVKGKFVAVEDEAVLDSVLSSEEKTKPPVHILGDDDTPYRCIGSLIYALQSKGYSQISFISDMSGSDPTPDQR